MADKYLNPTGLSRLWQKIKAYVDGKTAQATDSALGTVKLNPSESVGVNANGQLTVGGRLGQYPTTTGIYAPNNRDPRMVADYSMMVTDAIGMDMAANRALAVVSGYGTACKSAAAGTTEYHIVNNYANRIVAKLAEGGYASRDEATSKIEQIIPVLSVTINGSSFTPDSSNDSSSNDIIIKTAETLNPNSTITNIRLFGKMESYASLHIGNGVKSGGSGRSLMIGGAVTKAGGNDNCMVGMNMYVTGNGNAMFGRNHIARKNRGFLAGTGHDTTNARSEAASAVGEWSSITSTTLFAVGNGTSHTARSNAFEVTNDGGIVLKSPNGTRYKITMANDGTLSTAAV